MAYARNVCIYYWIIFFCICFSYIVLLGKLVDCLLYILWLINCFSNISCETASISKLPCKALSVPIWESVPVMVNQFGWKLAQKLGVIRYFKGHFGSLLWLFALEFQGSTKFHPSRWHFVKVLWNSIGKLYCQVNLTMDSTFSSD